MLAKYQPKVIKTDEENEQAIALAEELAHRLDKTAEESALLELLIALIEKYENETYPMGKSSSHSMLLHLMEARGIEEADLVEILSSSGITSEVIQGTEVISEAQAQTLANFFKVDPGLFF
ncbi:transcriptional regulator [Brasilonema sp. UFV-L1]|uniref:helix-turn-helix domain-containing protein n=1 Tax=Brasilonema sp. UFV-L1 TaxID=2234130 RepID=UPI001B7D1464|nr:transcriptional regulator [Brasilonema sp. UFV-L1]